jgi:hypothetical protein
MEQLQRRKNLLGLTVSEASVYHWLALLFLVHGGAEHQWCRGIKVVTSSRPRGRWRDREEAQDKEDTSPKNMPSVIYFLQIWFENEMSPWAHVLKPWSPVVWKVLETLGGGPS